MEQALVKGRLLEALNSSLTTSGVQRHYSIEPGIDIYHLGIKNVESEHFYMQLARFYLLEKNDEEKALKYLKSCIKKPGLSAWLNNLNHDCSKA